MHQARTLRERLVGVPLALDWPYWIEDDSFDVEFHVRHITLPAPGSWAQLMTQIARQHARPLDLTKPPWGAVRDRGLGAVGAMP